jgi:hypothetical protein
LEPSRFEPTPALGTWPRKPFACKCFQKVLGLPALPNEKGEYFPKSARLFILRLICSPVNSDGSLAYPSDWIQSLVNLMNSATLDSRRQFSIDHESIELARKKALKLAPRIPRASFHLQDFRTFPQEAWEPKGKYSGDFFLGRYSPVWLIQRRLLLSFYPNFWIIFWVAVLQGPTLAPESNPDLSFLAHF